MVRIGAHVRDLDPLQEAAARDAELVQFFLGDPQGWKGPVRRADTETLRSQRDVGLYIHAPYVINVATSNNRIRIPSRKLVSSYAAAAAEVGALGLIVHGGHVLAGDDPAGGCENWRKLFERAEFEVPILIENTAGGDQAMARRFDALGRLWDALDGYDVGFCLDTCHAFCAGEELSGIVDRVLAITGRIDLVHLNNSRDEFGSGRDRHAGLRAGTIDPDLLVEVVQAARCDVVVETPLDGQRDDIAFVRARLAG